MAAASGHCDVRSLIPGTIFRPAQTGQPVVPPLTERTAWITSVSNSCPQSGHTKKAFFPLLAATSEAESLFLLLHIAAAFGHCDARSLMPGATLSPLQTGQPVFPLLTEQTTCSILASNSSPQSGHTNIAFLLHLTAISEADFLFLLLHIAAISGYFDARSLMPGIIFLPAQTEQPVNPLSTERTILKILLSNSCPQSGHTKVSFLLLPAVTSKAKCLSFSLSIAATSGATVAKSFSPTISFWRVFLVLVAFFSSSSYGILMPRVGTDAQAAQLQELACIIIFMLVFMIDFSFVINKNKNAATLPSFEGKSDCFTFNWY